MADRRRAHCRCCGKHRDEVGEITWAGNCMSCADAILVENIEGIHTRTGYAHRRRLRGIAKYLERALLDEAQTSA